VPEADTFNLRQFLPYILNEAAEAVGLEFQRTYKERYGMLRTEWRVLFHLGQYGDMTARQVCDLARLHKTKVSRAVTALERKRFLTRTELAADRRHSVLTLTRQGRSVFHDLAREARAFDARIRADMTADESDVFQRCLMRIAKFQNR
jgi:DNA-binding MarR family transcriptional regulator